MVSESHTAVDLGHDPVFAMLVSGIDMQGLSIGFNGLCEELFAGFPSGSDALVMEGDAEVVLGSGPLLREIGASKDEQGLAKGLDGLSEELVAGFPEV